MTDTEPRTDHLKPITQRPDLRTYLRDLGQRLEYLREVPRADLRAENLNTVLGNVWFLLNPLLQTAVYLLVFGLLLNVDRGVDNYAVYLVIGVMVFRVITKTLTNGARTIRRNQTLMRSLYFPRAVIPIASALGNFYQFLPGLGIIVVVALATGEVPSWRWLAIPAILAIILVLATACGLFSARLGHIFPDLDQILPHVTRLLFYASGTIYDPNAFSSDPFVLALFDFNPIYQLLSLMRWAVMGQSVPGWFWITSPLYAVAALVGAFLFFWRGELTYGSPR